MKTFVNRPAEAALRRLAACLGAVILSTALLAGCGGESSAEDSPPVVMMRSARTSWSSMAERSAARSSLTMPMR